MPFATSPDAGPRYPEPSAVDRYLVQRAQSGQLDAFDNLVRRHAPSVRRRAFAILGQHEDAQETTQDTFVQAWSQLQEFRGECAFGTWLYPIVTRLAMTKARRRHPALDIDTAHNLAIRGPDPSDVAESAHTTQAVAAAVCALPVNQRDAVALVDLDGMSYAQAADFVDSALPALRSNLLRGRRRLMVLLRAGQ